MPRAEFVRKTCLYLAGAILAFAVLEAPLSNTPGVGGLVEFVLSSWLVVIGLFVGASWVDDRWRVRAVSPEVQYAGITLYVSAEAVVFLPLMYVAAYYGDPSVMPAAGILALLLFAGLTAVAVTTGTDFSFLRGRSSSEARQPSV